jgi:hypothetical protein
MTLLINAPLTEGGETVGTLVRHGPPAIAIPPDHQILIQEGEFLGMSAIEILQVKHGIPSVLPSGGSYRGSHRDGSVVLLCYKPLLSLG